MTDPTAFTTATQASPHPPERPGALESTVAPKEKVRSLWSDAWYDLRRKPLFWVSFVLIVIFVLMAAFPNLFTSIDPNVGDLGRRNDPPESGHWFGFDRQGRDVYARTIYGARVSIIVGLFSAMGVALLGGVVGVLAGFFGGWLDGLLSRIADIFFGIPFVLGAIVLLSTFSNPLQSQKSTKIAFLVIVSIVMLVWPQFARVMRSSVIATKQADYVQAARALGAGPGRIITRHVLPNAIAPLIIMTTIALGVFVGAEATLSYLGVGLRSPTISWGVMISDGQEFLDSAPHMLLFPAAFLSAAVLGFVMLGEAIREALDPKLR